MKTEFERKCDYCGEEEATEKIGDPNLDMSQDIDWSDEKTWWKVCKTCKEVIPLQRMSCIPSEVLQEYCNNKLAEIAKRTKKPILNATISKNNEDNYDFTSIEFTGES